MSKLQLDIKQKFIANRAATEVLNVQKLWRYVGVNIDASNLLRGAERRIRWVTTLLRAITLVDGVEPISDYTCRNDDYISHWLTEKANWLEGEVKKLDLSRRNFYIRISFSYFIAALGAVGSQLSPGYFFNIIFEVGIATTIVVFGFYELRGFEDTAARYKKSLSQFKAGINILEQNSMSGFEQNSEGDKSSFRNRQIQAVAEAMGREKIEEMNDWFADQLTRTYKP